jgi:hypothetical protein
MYGRTDRLGASAVVLAAALPMLLAKSKLRVRADERHRRRNVLHRRFSQCAKANRLGRGEVSPTEANTTRAGGEVNLVLLTLVDNHVAQ